MINTHVHADHITGTGRLKKLVQGTKSILSKVSFRVGQIFGIVYNLLNRGRRIEALVRFLNIIQCLFTLDYRLF